MGKFERKVLAKGEVLFRQGDAINNVYIIDSGKIDLFHSPNANNPGILVYQATPGEILGESILFGPSHYLTSARASEETVVSIVGIEVTKDIYNQAPGAVKKIVQTTFAKAKNIIEEQAKLLVLSEVPAEKFSNLLGCFFTALNCTNQDAEKKVSRQDLQKYIFRLFQINLSTFDKILHALKKAEVLDIEEEFSIFIKEPQALVNALKAYAKINLDPERKNTFLTGLELLPQLEALLELAKAAPAHPGGLIKLEKAAIIENLGKANLKFQDAQTLKFAQMDFHINQSLSNSGIVLAFYLDEAKALLHFLKIHQELTNAFERI